MGCGRICVSIRCFASAVLSGICLQGCWTWKAHWCVRGLRGSWCCAHAAIHGSEIPELCCCLKRSRAQATLFLLLRLFKAPLLQLGCFVSIATVLSSARPASSVKRRHFHKSRILTPRCLPLVGHQGPPVWEYHQVWSPLCKVFVESLAFSDSGIYTSFYWSHLLVIYWYFLCIPHKLFKGTSPSSNLFLSVSSFSIGCRHSLFIDRVSKVEFSSLENGSFAAWFGKIIHRSLSRPFVPADVGLNQPTCISLCS